MMYTIFFIGVKIFHFLGIFFANATVYAGLLMVSYSKNGEFLKKLVPHFLVMDGLQVANSLNRCNKSCPYTKHIEAIAIINLLKN